MSILIRLPPKDYASYKTADDEVRNRKLLPDSNPIDPYDWRKGKRWLPKVRFRLEAAELAILCLNIFNMGSK